MDERFLNYYEEELRFVREMADEFAAAHPTIAKRLSLDGPECEDPYTERLLEGFAFLTARVRLRMDSGFPAFTETLLNRVMPSLTAPVPSVAIVEFEPNLSEGALVEGVRLVRGTSLLARAETGQTACDYRLAHDLVMWPLTIEAADYLDRAAEAEGPDLHDARAVIRVRVSTPGIPLSKLKLDRLSLFLAGRDDLPDRLLQQLAADALAVVVRPAAADAKSVRLPRSSIVHRGFDDDEALLPQTALGFSGHRLLQEFFMLPKRMCFVAIDGLGQSIKTSQATAFDIFFVLRKSDNAIASRVDAKAFRLNCAPAINLFPRQADRIRYQPNRAEHALVVDRSRAHEFEVHTVLSVEGVLGGTSRRVKFAPLYASHDPGLGDQPSAYFSVRRERRIIASSPEQEGTETYIGLVNLGTGGAVSEISQLAIDTLCTNRRLPNTLRSGVSFSINEAVPVRAARAIVGPTPPGLPLASGARSWNLVDLLAFNHSGFSSDASANAAHLRRILGALSDASSADQRRMVDSLTRLGMRRVTRRIPGSGPAAFGLGLEFRLFLDSIGLRGIGGFAFAAVLERFLARSATINSFAETVLEDGTGETIARWPARLGTYQIV